MNWETMYNKINNLINHMNQDTVILMKNTSRQLNNNVANYLGYNGLNANTILGETPKFDSCESKITFKVLKILIFLFIFILRTFRTCGII